MYHCSICEKEMTGKVWETFDESGEESSFPIIACSKVCCEKFDKELREQGDVIPKWEPMLIASSTIDAGIARLERFGVKTKDGHRVVSLVINLGGDVSTDELSKFCGELVELRLQKSELVPEKAEKKTGKKVALKEAQAEAVS